MTAAPCDQPLRLRTPFHARVQRACEVNEWGEWKGYTTPDCYTQVSSEYFAIRAGTAVFDLSPMTKYRIAGPDAAAYLDRLVTRNIARLGVGRVGYAVWCNDSGQVIDDGTIFRFSEQDFRLCCYERIMDWLLWSAASFDVQIVDETAAVAALAVQGPTSCAVLRMMGLEGLQHLKPYAITTFPFQGSDLTVSRTGFTGDLGYELWIAPQLAEELWDRLFSAKKNYHILPIGSHALNLARIEAGFLQSGVDFVSAEHTVRRGRSRSPLELGLGWLVDFDKPLFNGRKALLREKAQGPRYRLVKLDIEGNKPAEHSFIYRKRKAVGTVTSAAWCPTAKINVAFAFIDTAACKTTGNLRAEIYYQRELHWTRAMARCRVLEKPIFNPPRRHATPAPDY